MEEESRRAPEVCIILNPNAAKGKASRQRDKIETCFTDAGYRCEIVSTKAPQEAVSLASQAVRDGWKLIVAAGGDGTINEVVDGTMRAVEELGLSPEQTPLIGLIPIGRGNDFAFSAGISKDIPTACKRIMEGERRRIDVGIVYGGDFPEGRHFINGVGMGFEPLVNFCAMDFKRVSGMLSYVLALIKILCHYPAPIQLTMKTDNGEERLSTQQISICNGRRMGSTFLMGPDAILDDGLLDIVYAAQPIKGSELIPIALLFFKGKQTGHRYFKVQRTKNIVLDAPAGGMPVHADGEVISRNCSSISVELFPGVLTVMV